MRKENLPGYGYPVLAVWPQLWYEAGRWRMYEYKLKPNGKLAWYKAFIQVDHWVKAEVYESYQEAIEVANLRNAQLLQSIATFEHKPELIRSLELKAIKAIQTKTRLANEEQLMLAEAKRRSQHLPRVDIASLELDDKAESYREQLYEQLLQMPYLRVVFVHSKDDQCILYQEAAKNNKWFKADGLTNRKAEIAERAKIANGFGFSGVEHWGETKAAIRSLLLPRANQLLQLASVQRLLAEALTNGQRVLVAGGYVFWYEEEGQIGWQIKETNRSGETAEETVWREGTIVSKNHGRLVILPFIKESGECVQGHTRNAPHDGPAKPRHPDHYVELPFEVLSDDLMIGLFGELPYE